MPSYLEINAYRLELGVPVDWVPVTTTYEGIFRAIRATDDCNVVLTTANGEERTMAFLAGETRWVLGTEIASVSAGTLEVGI
jgi:hypothetical protein